MDRPSYDSFILEFKNCVPNELCDEIINFYESNDCHKTIGKTTYGVNLNIKKSIEGYISNCQLLNKIYKIVDTTKRKYQKNLENKNLDENDIIKNLCDKHHSYTKPQIQKINTDGFYNWHNDYVIGQDRFLSIIIYLNTLEDDAGGCTSFTSGVSIKPEKGKILIFPAQIPYIHRGDIVKKGPKYICTFFSMLDNCVVKTCNTPFILKD